eukprot:2052056-Prymnesium_polylepis.1
MTRTVRGAKATCEDGALRALQARGKRQRDGRLVFGASRRRAGTTLSKTKRGSLGGQGVEKVSYLPTKIRRYVPEACPIEGLPASSNARPTIRQ